MTVTSCGKAPLLSRHVHSTSHVPFLFEFSPRHRYRAFLPAPGLQRNNRAVVSQSPLGNRERGTLFLNTFAVGPTSTGCNGRKWFRRPESRQDDPWYSATEDLWGGWRLHRQSPRPGEPPAIKRSNPALQSEPGNRIPEEKGKTEISSYPVSAVRSVSPPALGLGAPGIACRVIMWIASRMNHVKESRLALSLRGLGRITSYLRPLLTRRCPIQSPMGSAIHGEDDLHPEQQPPPPWPALRSSGRRRARIVLRENGGGKEVGKWNTE